MDKTEVWNMVPFDVRLLGGMVIHNGGISEMMTGEGKTLTASFTSLPQCFKWKKLSVGNNE